MSFKERITLTADRLFTAVTENPYDTRTRQVQVVVSRRIPEPSTGRISVGLIPLDHAQIALPARDLEGTLCTQKVSEMIARQKKDQSNEYVFPVITVRDYTELFGRGGNNLSCSLEVDDRPLLRAAFTYSRCPLGFFANENKLNAAFWRPSNTLSELIPWIGFKQKQNETHIPMPILPGRLMVFSQAELTNHQVNLVFSNKILSSVQIS